jgi:hypothetical protein
MLLTQKTVAGEFQIGDYTAAPQTGALPDPNTKAGGHANRNAGFIRQTGEPC